MNKYALHVAGGALLATTALASGTVYAATIKVLQGSPGFGSTATFGTAIATATVPVTTNAFTSTGSTITVGPATIVVDTSSNQNTFFGTQTTVQLVITGAEFNTSFTPSVDIYGQETTTSGSLTTTTTVGAVPFVASDRITINSVTGVTFGAMVFSGIVFRNAQGLATAGNTVALSGSILNSSGVLTIETITSQTFLSARAGTTIGVAGGATAQVSNTTSPQFTGVTQSGATSTTVVLSTVNFTEVGSVGTALSNSQSVSTLISTYEVKLTHGVLSDAAVATVGFVSSAAATVNRTPAQFVSGSVTFGSIAPGTADSTAVRTLFVTFNGSTAIANAAAGTTTVTPTAAAAAATGVAAGSGTAAALTRGGMNASVNFFQPSTNSIQSFVRVTNIGSTAGAVTLTVRNASTGASIGTYTSASIAAGATVQISGSVLETQSSPAITPTTGVPYDITVSGPITGFVQHIGFNTATGQLSDLSGFRTGSSGATP